MSVVRVCNAYSSHLKVIIAQVLFEFYHFRSGSNAKHSAKKCKKNYRSAGLPSLFQNIPLRRITRPAKKGKSSLIQVCFIFVLSMVAELIGTRACL